MPRELRLPAPGRVTAVFRGGQAGCVLSVQRLCACVRVLSLRVVTTSDRDVAMKPRYAWLGRAAPRGGGGRRGAAAAWLAPLGGGAVGRERRVSGRVECQGGLGRGVLACVCGVERGMESACGLRWGAAGRQPPNPRPSPPPTKQNRSAPGPRPDPPPTDGGPAPSQPRPTGEGGLARPSGPRHRAPVAVPALCAARLVVAAMYGCRQQWCLPSLDARERPPSARCRSPPPLAAPQRSHPPTQLSTSPHSAASTGAHAVCAQALVRSARQTAELHLKPEPKAICHTRSPLRMPVVDSMRARMYLGHGGQGAGLVGRGRVGRQAGAVSPLPLSSHSTNQHRLILSFSLTIWTRSWCCRTGPACPGTAPR